MKKMIIPAIIAKSQEELEININKVKDFVDLIQLDFMDGNFVPNQSIDFDFKLPEIDGVYEAHLMIADPINWTKKYYENVDMILVHFESCKNPSEVIAYVNMLDRNEDQHKKNLKTVCRGMTLADEADTLCCTSIADSFYTRKEER